MLQTITYGEHGYLYIQLLVCFLLIYIKLHYSIIENE